MSTTTLGIYSVPSTEDGLSLTCRSTGVFPPGRWKVLCQNTKVEIYMLGLVYNLTVPGGTDTTTDLLFRIALGNIGKEVEKLQLPFSFRPDSLGGHYFPSQGFFLPEPYLIPAGSTVSVNLSNNTYGTEAGEGTILANGIKMRYMATQQVLPPSITMPNIQNFMNAGIGEKAF